MTVACTKTIGATRVSVRALDGFFRRCDPLCPNDCVETEPRLLTRFELATSSWARLAAKVAAAQQEIEASSPDTKRHVKVLFLVRHGQGFHNAAVEAMGKIQWNTEGAYEAQYIDARLTPTGVLQARCKGAVAMARERQRGMPIVERCITSPLTRAIETATYFFSSQHVPRPFIAIESCREVMDTHVCNQRRPLSELVPAFPDVDFNVLISSANSNVDMDVDAFYSRTDRETLEQQHTRVVQFLVDVCRACPTETYVAVSSHADFMRSMWGLLCGERLKPAHCEVFPLVMELTEHTDAREGLEG